MNNEKENRHIAKRLAIQSLTVFLIVAVIMTVFETLKQFIHPSITIWGSHMITIAFSSIVAAAAAFFVFKKQNSLYDHVLIENFNRKLAENELIKTIADLQEAKSKIKTLAGLLPICASCKKIRDDRGKWHVLETYIHNNTDTKFTHGICPDCVERLYPDFGKKKKSG